MSLEDVLRGAAMTSAMTSPEDFLQRSALISILK
jgi:hypothetical protein